MAATSDDRMCGIWYRLQRLHEIHMDVSKQVLSVVGINLAETRVNAADD